MPNWLPTLTTETPEDGYQLAIKLSRMAVKKTQPDESVRGKLRIQYEQDAHALLAIAHTVSINFATIAAANGYWAMGQQSART